MPLVPFGLFTSSMNKVARMVDSDACDCNDYSLLTANTGLGTVYMANPNLNGSGNVVTAITANGTNGTIVKSITIKALQQTTQGMIRLFIKSNAMTPVVTLYKEVPIPIQPKALAVPIPMYILYETVLMDEFKLQSGYSLIASTQNSESFNIIVNGLDVTYPRVVPDVCCNFEQNDAGTRGGMITVGNTNLDGTVSTGRVNIFTADSSQNGAIIKSVTIKALQSTHENTVRLWVSDGADYFLMREIWIPQTTQSAFKPSFKQVVNMNLNLAPGYIIAATTDISESYAITVEATNWSYPI